jgi:hypothetical protein
MLGRDIVMLFVALGSIGMGVLATASADGLGTLGGTLATVAAWVVIAVVNVAHAMRR